MQESLIDLCRSFTLDPWGYQQLFETHRHGVILHKTSGEILAANPQAVDLLGHPLARLKAESLPSLLKLDTEAVRALWDADVPLSARVLLPRAGKADVNVEVQARTADADDGLVLMMLRDVSEQRCRAVEQAKMAAIVENAEESIILCDRYGLIESVNPAFEKASGYRREELTGQHFSLIEVRQQAPHFCEDMWEQLRQGQSWHGVMQNRHKNGSLFEEEGTVSPICDEAGRTVSFVAIKRDVTKERKLQKELNQAHKLRSVGQLAAGIAHEINTPTQYVGDNTRFLREVFAELRPILECLLPLENDEAGTDLPASFYDQLRHAVRKTDLAYLCREIPQSIDQSLEGIDRVTTIVAAMKEFSHSRCSERKSMVDLNHAIRSTATVARNEWKYVADLRFELQEDVPLVSCFVDEISQVVLNLLVNAAHAIKQANQQRGPRKATITITTRETEGWAEISVRDMGMGIPEEIQDRIFEPFFTTKPVGEGTGQGLSLAHSIVHEHHGGTLAFTTRPGDGTTFSVRIPLTARDGDEVERQCGTGVTMPP